MLGVVVLAVLFSTRDHANPFKIDSDHAHRIFAREFWHAEPNYETICVRRGRKSDLPSASMARRFSVRIT